MDQKFEEELNFWLHKWDASFREGNFWNKDVVELLTDADSLPANFPESLSYWDIRWMEAKAQELRILKEAGIEDRNFFNNKFVVDIGPGAVCFLEVSSARIKVAVEPLSIEFQKHGLLLPEGNTLYLTTGAEQLPLLNDVVDVVVSRNSLDHVENPAQAMREIHRVLKPGGILILNTDINHPGTICEPHTLTPDIIHMMTAQFDIVRETTCSHGPGHSGGDGGVYIGVLEKQRDTARDVI